jgi:hypothetical protein
MEVEHFIIAGAQRSGTTWLYRQLESHPQICMAQPLRPEPKFFLRENAVKLGYTEYRTRHFSHWCGERLLGEKSTSYIERTDSIPRIRAVLPDTRLIFVLRDPVKRAYSNWRFSRAQGREQLSFEDALAEETVRVKSWNDSDTSVCPFAYAARGHYSRYLGVWEHHFPRDRMIVTTSELLFQGGSALSDVFTRLGLDAEAVRSATDPVNASEEENGRPSDAAARVLSARYKDEMRILRQHWGVDVSAWLP